MNVRESIIHQLRAEQARANGNLREHYYHRQQAEKAVNPVERPADAVKIHDVNTDHD